MLDAVATRYGSREAMVFGEVRVSFAEFRERVNRLARGLAALGIRHGENVAIWLPNRPEWFFAQYACAHLGAVVIALNPRYKAHELSYILGQSEAKALLMTDHLGDDVVSERGDDHASQLRPSRLDHRRRVAHDAPRSSSPRAPRGWHLGRPQHPTHDVEPRRLPRPHGRVRSPPRAPAHRARAL